MHKKPTIIFFGTSAYAVMVLSKLHESGMTPVVIITTPDKPAGKRLEMNPSPVKVWTLAHNLPLHQPEKLKDEAFQNEIKKLNPDLGIVVAYGKIIPQSIIDIPKHGTLNVHASLLPKLRGASPIETAVLTDERKTGVTIMVVDSEMDHGPIVASEEVVMEPWPPEAATLGKVLVASGAKLLIESIPGWIEGTLKAKEQDHSKATYTKKIEKTDGELDLSADPYQNFLKIQAYHDWPGTFFFVEKAGKKIRVLVKKATYENGELTILRVVPEGKKETAYSEFKKTLG